MMGRCEYYLIDEDDRISNKLPVYALKLDDKLFLNELDQGAPDSRLVIVNDLYSYEILDFMFLKGSIILLNPEYRGMLFIANKYRSIFSKYDKGIKLYSFVILNHDGGEPVLYWLARPSYILNYKSEININNVKLSFDDVCGRYIIYIETKTQGYLLVSLEVVESILRRSPFGIKIKSYEIF